MSRRALIAAGVILASGAAGWLALRPKGGAHTASAPGAGTGFDEPIPGSVPSPSGSLAALPSLGAVCPGENPSSRRTSQSGIAVGHLGTSQLGTADGRSRAVEWTAVPMEPRSVASEVFGSFEARRTLSRTLRDEPRRRYRPCFDSWIWPPGLQHLEMEVELRLRSTAGGFDVEDAIVSFASASDSSLERCVADAFRGQHVELGEGSPGRMYRISWGLRVYSPALRAAAGSPETNQGTDQ